MAEICEPITWRSGWVALLASLAARMILVAGATLVLWSVAPAAIGWHPTVTMSGSMEPAIHPGDVVISRPIGHTRLRAGMIILADDPDATGNHAEAELLVHRIHHVNAHHTYTTKGDANAVTDSDPVTPGHVHGLAVLLVPWIGHPYLWAHTHHLGALAGFTALTALLIWLAALHHEPHDPNSPRPRRRHRKPTPHRDTATAAAATTTALVVAATVIWPLDPAHAAYTSANTNTGNTLTAAAYYTCKNAALAANPSALWLLNETSGTGAADASGNANTGTYGSGVTLSQSRACATDSGYSAKFDGSATSMVHGSTAYNDPETFTLEAWFRTSTAGGRIVSLSTSQTANSTWCDRTILLNNTGQLMFAVHPSKLKYITTSAAYNDGAWHLVDATLAASGTQVYVDGALVGTDSTITASYSATTYLRAGYDIYSNCGGAAPSNAFTGWIDNPAYYPTVLTAAQVAAHYAARS